jgi:hypothetical protein
VRPGLLAACIAVASAACFVVAYFNRNADLEGAYFDSPGAGWTAYAAVEDPIFNPFDPWNGYLWLGAGIAFALAALMVLALKRFAKPSQPGRMTSTRRSG